MNYFEVMVASQRYHSFEPLTYSSEATLSVGDVVSVPLKNQTVPAVVTKSVSKPSFKSKEIIEKIGVSQLPDELIRLTEWINEYYPSPGGLIMQTVLPASVTQHGRQRDNMARANDVELLPKLTSEQQRALQEINQVFPLPVLLHGETATGKTRVYTEIATQQIEAGKSVLVLTPEIGLTPQLVRSFQHTFTQPVSVLHSNLTPAEKRQAWLSILDHQGPQIVIGPRSALFAPVHNLGTIIIDEFHEQSFKQSQAPYYQTTRVAAHLASLHRAQLILGSATPLVSDYFAFKAKDLSIVRMVNPAIMSSHTLNISVVHLRDSEQFSRSKHLSVALINAISTTLELHEQSLIFLNRRGSARLVLCENCGWQAVCPRCDIPLTYHGDEHKMHCHTCGYHDAAPSSCPECGHADLHYKSIGTKTIVEEIKKLFPAAKIKRFDSDLEKAERLESVYKDLRDGKVDILVGTQMLSKGLDLPKLSLLGIINADTSHYLPDYTADEQAYQLLTQLMGRVARGHRDGQIIVQTHHPDDPTLLSALERNYEKFYSKQIDQRQAFRYPPFCYLLKLRCSRRSSKSAQTAANGLVELIKSLGLAVETIGPSPAFQAKSHNQYHWQVIVKSKQRKHLVKIIKALPANVFYDLDPVNLL